MSDERLEQLAQSARVLRVRKQSGDETRIWLIFDSDQSDGAKSDLGRDIQFRIGPSKGLTSYRRFGLLQVLA